MSLYRQRIKCASNPMRIEEAFPLIVCLNLDRRPDRRLRAWEQFTREGLNVERLSAPDAAEMSCVTSRRYEKTGPRACAVGHRMAWREARRRGASAALVFEDDVILAEGFYRKLDLWLTSVPQDSRLLYLGGVFRDPPTMIAPGLLRVTGRTWDMHAYAVHANAIPGLNRAVAPLSWPQTRGTGTFSRTSGSGYGDPRASSGFAYLCSMATFGLATTRIVQQRDCPARELPS